MIYYTTVNDIQEQLMKETPEDVPDPTTEEYTNFTEYVVNQLIPNVSKIIDYKTNRFFVPLYETRNYFNRNLAKVDCLEKHRYYLDPWQGRLYLDNELLELESYTSTGVEVSTDSIRVSGNTLDLDVDDNDFDFNIGSFANSQDVLGYWGYHTDWDNAFIEIEDISIDESTTTITVGASNLYKYPQYIKCEEELMLITALTDATTLTVQRGVRGTTKAAHSSKALYTYTPDQSLHIAATRFCSWLYNNRVSQGNIIQIANSSVIIDQLPTAVHDVLEHLKDRRPI